MILNLYYKKTKNVPSNNLEAIINDKLDLVSQSIFGGLDGLVSVLGVIIGLAAASHTKIIDAAIGLALASSISMGVGEYLGDDQGKIKNALYMGIATLIGTLIPIMPFIFFSKGLAFIIVGILTIAFGGLVGFAKKQGLKGYVLTYVLLCLAIIITIIAAVITGAGG